MVRINTPEEKLKLELLRGTTKEERCGHLALDREGFPYCGKDYVSGTPISEERRIICDTASLQLYCLDKERFDVCIVYRGEEFLV